MQLCYYIVTFLALILHHYHLCPIDNTIYIVIFISKIIFLVEQELSPNFSEMPRPHPLVVSKICQATLISHKTYYV